MVPVDLGPAAGIEHLARRAPSTRSLVYGNRVITASQLHADTLELAATLAAGGVRAGDRVAYLGRNSPALLVTLLACSHLGSIFVPVNFRLTATEVARVLADCGAHTVLVEPPNRAVAEQIAPGLETRRWLLVDTDPLARAEAASPDVAHGTLWTGLGAALGSAGPVPRRTVSGPDDVATILYTSGTTGLPKGVVLTNGNLWWSSANTDLVTDTRAGDVHLAVAPMFHIGGLNAFALRTLVHAGTVLLHRTFDAARVLAAIRDDGVTTLFGVPAMYAAVAREPDFATTDLSGVHVAMVAGAPVPPRLVDAFAERGLLLQQSWGMTETAPAAACIPADQALAHPCSAGLPMPYTRLRLVDPTTGRDVELPDSPGEIWVQGPNVFPGYWRNPAATAEAFPEPGWLRTGDIARRDVGGFYSVCGRIKDMINSGGENVYPAEIERVLAGAPGVADVAVIGVPDEVWGETVLAAVVCAPGADVTLAQVRAHAAHHLARYKLPSHLVVLTTLPRNGGGKVDKTALRAALVPEAADPCALG
jgi:acyl-CoA synthetase (AMP-forming)/AMP-acid ligase II